MLKISKTLNTLSAMSVLALVAACGGGGGSGSSSGGTGTMSFSVTDAPGDYENVFVTITGVRVNQDGSEDADGDGFEEMTITNPQRIDLLDLQNGSFESLGNLTLPAGNYSQARLVLAENSSSSEPFANAVVLEGETAERPLTTPSAQQSGLKVNIDLDVGEGEVVDLRIDFDANKSVVERGNSGQYNLKPVLSAVPVLASGVEGSIDTTTTGENTFVTLQQQGEVIASTTPTDAGTFELSPVDPASNYDVVITSTGKSTVVVTDVPVTESETTDLDMNQTFVLQDDGSETTFQTASGFVSNDENSEQLRTTVTFSQALASSDSDIVIASLPLTLVDHDSDEATDDRAPYSQNLSNQNVLVAPYVESGSFAFQSDGDTSRAQYTASVLADYMGARENETQTAGVDVSSGDVTQNFEF